MAVFNRVLMVLMLLLALVHLYGFAGDRQPYHLAATAGFGLLAWNNLRNPELVRGADGRWLARDPLALRLAGLGVALLLVYFGLKLASG